MPKDAALDKALGFDALKTAEEIAEGACMNPEPLGFLLHIGNSQRKEHMLKERGDTYFSMPFSDFIAVALSLGFKLGHTEKFHANERVETYNVMYHPAGVLLSFDSYDVRVNSASFYYNWRPHDKKTINSLVLPKLTSSGMWYPSPEDIRAGRGTEDDWVWGGDWDAREGMKYNLQNLHQYGEFLNPWQYDTSLNLCHFVDWREIGKLPFPESSQECDRRTLERLRLLPTEARAIVPETMFSV